MSLGLSHKQRLSMVEAKTAKLALWSGAVSSGKTIASLYAFLDAVADAPDSGLIIIVGRSLQTIERNIFDPLADPALFDQRIVRTIHHTTGSTTANILGRTVHLIGASDVRSEGRIRGATVAIALVDEATLLPQSFWMMLLSRLRVPGDRSRLLATTNPGPPNHWLRKDFILRAGEVGMANWHFNLADNPSNTPRYVADLHAQYRGMWRRRFIDGEWVMAEGAVFEAFDPDRHVLRGPLPKLSRLLGCGVDYGASNPCAALLLGVQDEQGTRPARLVLAREWRHDPKVAQRTLTVAEVAQQFTEWLGPTKPPWIVVDPAAKAFRDELFLAQNHDVLQADNAVLPGLHLVASLLATGHLVIHESCKALLDEIPGYSWDTKAAEKGEDKPIKVDDHSIDAARYVIATTEGQWRWLVPTAPTRVAA